MLDVLSRNRAVKAHLEEVYRCSVSVSSYRDDIKLRFSHMPRELESLSHPELRMAVAKSVFAAGVKISDSKEVIISITITRPRK